MKRFLSTFLAVVMIMTVVIPVTVAAEKVYIDESFDSTKEFFADFIAGDFFILDGVLKGYESAKALTSKYRVSDGLIDNTLNTWLTYDASVTLGVGIDETVDADNERFISLIYMNYNTEPKNSYISFVYDIYSRCFRLIDTFKTLTDGNQLMQPVYAEIGTDAHEETFTMGISVSKGRIRCFNNGELIFDYEDASIAEEKNSPFFFWNMNNFVCIYNIMVTEHGYLYAASEYPDTDEPVDEEFNIDENGTLTVYHGKDGDIEIPDTVKAIGDDAFINCSTITGVTIPEGMTGIGNRAFSECGNLMSIIIPESVVHFGDEIFTNSPNVTIRCYKNSAAHTYAVDNNIPYVLLDGDASEILPDSPGNVNGDTKIDITDAILMLKHIAQWGVTINTDAADVNDDGKVSIDDVILLLKYITKWDGIVLK